jgi:heptosyltransferase III
VVFPGALGDFVCFLPALRAIREASEGPVTLLCKAELAGLARFDGVREVWPLEGRAASWLFSPEPPPEADELFGAFSAIRSFTGSGDPTLECNVARWVGASGSVSPFRPRAAVHAAVHFLRTVGVETIVPPRISLEIPEPARAEARGRLREVVNNRPLLLVHPGSGGSLKRWSSAGFRSVIEAWQSEIGDAAILLGPAERDEIDAWRSAGSPVLAPETPTELAAMLAVGDVYLGNDSGPTHLAAAVGLRGVALFGPSDAVRWRPLGERLDTLELETWTSHLADATSSSVLLVWQALTRASRGALP